MTQHFAVIARWPGREDVSGYAPAFSAEIDRYEDQQQAQDQATILNGKRNTYPMRYVVESVDGPAPEPIIFNRGDRVAYTQLYCNAAGVMGTVEKVWQAQGGTWLRLNFGKNAGGETLRASVPANVLHLLS